MSGKVVLLDFWTYTCINCLRTLPYLQAWNETYASDGLVILGIHTPEFNFEKVTENVREATANLGVTWPVALDNGRETWDAFNVQAWPTKILLDRTGKNRYRKVGEGGYLETEGVIRMLLEENAEVDLAHNTNPDEPNFAAYRGITREIYAGSFRDLSSFQPFLGNAQGRGSEAFEYTDTLAREDGSFYLQGLWQREKESIIHARSTEMYEDYVAISYVAGEVNVVLSLLDGDQVRVRVTLVDEPVPEEARGADVFWDEEAQGTYLTVTEARMYRVIKTSVRERHELRLAPRADTFTLHAYTFGP